MKNLYIIPLFLALVALGFCSCKKPATPKAVITIQNINDVNVPNCRVIVYSNPNNSIIRDTLITNSAGQVQYESLHERILNVIAEKTIGVQKFVGHGVIILREDHTDYLTIKIN